MTFSKERLVGPGIRLLPWERKSRRTREKEKHIRRRRERRREAQRRKISLMLHVPPWSLFFQIFLKLCNLVEYTISQFFKGLSKKIIRTFSSIRGLSKSSGYVLDMFWICPGYVVVNGSWFTGVAIQTAMRPE